MNYSEDDVREVQNRTVDRVHGPDLAPKREDHLRLVVLAMAATAGIPDLVWTDESIDAGGAINRLELLAGLRAQGVAIEEVWLRGGGMGWRVLRQPVYPAPKPTHLRDRVIAVIRAGLDVEQVRALEPSVRDERARNIAAALLGEFDISVAS